MATSMCMRLVRHERGELRDYGVSGPAYSLDLELHSQVSCTGAWTSEKEGSLFCVEIPVKIESSKSGVPVLCMFASSALQPLLPFNCQQVVVLRRLTWAHP